MAFQALLSVTVIQFLQASSAVSSFTLVGVKLQLSSAFHPQSDGQSEAINKVIAMLRCLVGDRPHQWLHWLARAEYCYNMAFHSSLNIVRTWRFTLRSRHHHSVWSTIMIPLHYCPTSMVKLSCQQFIVSSMTETSFFKRYVNASSKRKHVTSIRMIVIIGSWILKWGNGVGFVYCTDRSHRCKELVAASSDPSFMVCLGC
jgi:hypothetical protein